MTIEVQILNKDSTRTVQVVPVEHDKETGKSRKLLAHEIPPGCSQTFHCHLLLDFLVREKTP